MIEWTQVGRRVVCINDKWSHVYEDVNPYLNQILTIREIVKFAVYKDVFLRFEEIYNEKTGNDSEEYCSECCYIYENFRPVKETNIKCFTSILQNLPKTKEKEYERA